MIISLRSVVNTTLFWIVIALSFRAYTRFINAEPAKYFLHSIGRDTLWNITIITENNNTISDETKIDVLSNELIAQRLDNIEQICAKSVRLYMYDQLPSSTPSPLYPSLTSQSTSSTTTPSLTTSWNSVRIIENNTLYGLSGMTRTL